MAVGVHAIPLHLAYVPLSFIHVTIIPTKHPVKVRLILPPKSVVALCLYVRSSLNACACASMRTICQYVPVCASMRTIIPSRTRVADLTTEVHSSSFSVACVFVFVCMYASRRPDDLQVMHTWIYRDAHMDVYMYICIYICIYVYTCIHTHIHARTDTQTDRYTHKQTQRHRDTETQRHTQTHTDIYAHVGRKTHTNT
jgi:hypothetical protein